MKKIILSVIVTIISLTLQAQGNYEKAMHKGLAMMDSASTFQSALDVSNYFERIAGANKTVWLPLYYAAYNSLSAGYFASTNQKKDELYQRGLSFIEEAKKIKQDESELLAMEGYLQLMYISNEPMKRAAAQTGEAIGKLEEAKKLNPVNPRPYFIHGQNTFYTPKFFGGGSANAKPILEKARELFKTFKPENDLMPDWGQSRCEMLLKECDKEEK